MHLHFASTPSRSNAAIRELARAFVGTRPGFQLSSTGFHSMAHLLPMLGLADRLLACFFGDHYPAPRPNPLYGQLAQAGVAFEHWPLWSLVASFRAAAQGDDWVVNRSLRGTTIATELAARGAYREIALPGEPPQTIGLCAALRPDLVFVHGSAGDDEGHVAMSGPLSEGMWSALAARRGVIATVERIVSPAELRGYAQSIELPPHRVLAVCEEPFGAHPQPLYWTGDLAITGYRDDFEHYERWRAMTTNPAALADFVDRVVGAPDGGAAYRDYVGASRLAALRALPVAPQARAADDEQRRSDAGARIPSDAGVLWTKPREATRGGVNHPASPEGAVLEDSEHGSLRTEPREATRGGVNHPASPGERGRGSPLSINRESPLSIENQLIVNGARELARRAREIGAQVLIAGIGQAFFAARLAQLQLAASGYALRVMVETGLYDVDCGPEGHGYLLAYDNVARARRLTAIDDILGALVCGADNHCIAALGAAQIDRDGNLNSTRLGGRLLVGSGGACDIAASAEAVVVMTRLGPGRLVDQLDYVTSPGRAVRSIATDRCVLTRPAEARSGGDRGATGWTLDSVTKAGAPGGTGAPGGPDRAVSTAGALEASIAAIARDCPWPLAIPASLSFAPPIDRGEADLLDALDPTGRYRLRAG
jgi:acyl CoA:acetate/3-ketoacid CoA transferase beta subunit/acyl CoA:acetate/3-ketoacid CoA transferase alpha subunit